MKKAPFKMKGHELPGPFQKKPPVKFVDLTKGIRDKLMMSATGGMLGDKSKGTDRDSLLKNKR